MILLINKEEQKRGNGGISAELSQYVKTIDFNEPEQVKEEDEIVVYFSGRGAVNQVLNSMKKLPEKIKVVWFMADLSYIEQFPVSAHKKFDYIFTPYADTLKSLNGLTKKNNAYFLPQAAHKFEYNGKPRIKKEGVFFGNLGANIYHKNRMEIMNEIKKHISVLTISNGQYHSPEQTYFYANSMFSINICPDFGDGASNRLYNIMAAGGVVLTNHIPIFDRMFENHRDLIYFKDISELKQIFEFYKKNPDDLIAIKNNARIKFETFFSGKRIIENMEDIINGKINEFRGLIYEKKYYGRKNLG